MSYYQGQEGGTEYQPQGYYSSSNQRSGEQSSNQYIQQGGFNPLLSSEQSSYPNEHFSSAKTMAQMTAISSTATIPGSQRYQTENFGSNGRQILNYGPNFSSERSYESHDFDQERNSFKISNSNIQNHAFSSQSVIDQARMSTNFESQFSNSGHRISTVEHPKRVVDMRQGRGTVVETRQGQATVVDVIEKEGRVVNEKVIIGESKIVNERELKRNRPSLTRDIKREEITTDIVKTNKTIELIKEVGVPVETYIDVVYDVVVDIPIERTIEREQITEVVVEKPIEKVIEVIVEQEIEIPVEKVIEVPVEIKREVQVPRERIVQVPYDVVRENYNYRERIIDVPEHEIGRFDKVDQILPTEVDYRFEQRITEKPIMVDNIIEKQRIIEKPVTIEVPREKVLVHKYPVEIERPVPQEKIIYQDYEVPVLNPVYVDKEILVEKPVFKERVIEKPVERVKLVEKEVIVPVEHIVEKPVFVDNVIQQPVERFVEVPVAQERFFEVHRDQYSSSTVGAERVIERPVEKVLRKQDTRVRQVQVPMPIEVANIVPREVQVPVQRITNRFFENPVERIVERPSYVERIIERPKIVERMIEIPVEDVRERVRTVERIVEKPVVIETEVIKHVEHIVIKDVPIPVERIVEVEVEVTVPKPIIRETLIEEELLIQAEFQEYDDNYELHEEFEHEDEELAREIDNREIELNEQVRQNNLLRDQFENLRRELESFRAGTAVHDEAQNALLRAKLDDLQRRAQAASAHNQHIRQRAAKLPIRDTQFRKDPRAEELKSRLRNLIGENNALADQVVTTGEELRKLLQKKQSEQSQSQSWTKIESPSQNLAYTQNYPSSTSTYNQPNYLNPTHSSQYGQFSEVVNSSSDYSNNMTTPNRRNQEVFNHSYGTGSSQYHNYTIDNSPMHLQNSGTRTPTINDSKSGLSTARPSSHHFDYK